MFFPKEYTLTGLSSSSLYPKVVEDESVIKKSKLALLRVESSAIKLKLIGGLLYSSVLITLPKTRIFVLSFNSLTTSMKFEREPMSSISSITLFLPPPNTFKSENAESPVLEFSSSNI